MLRILNLKRIIPFIVVVTLISCEKEIEHPVPVHHAEYTTTGSASSINFFKAQLTGTALAEVKDSYGILLSEKDRIPAEGVRREPASHIGANNEFKVSVSNLKPGTRYYYRSYMQIPDTLLMGELKSFQTESLDKIISTANYDVSLCGVTMRASLDTSGTDSSITEYGFRYGTAPDALTDSVIVTNLSDGEFFSELHSIEGEKIYYAGYAKVGGFDVSGKARLFEMPTWEYVVKYGYGTKVQIGESLSLLWEKGDRVLVTDMKDTVSCFVSEQYAGTSSFKASFRRFFSTPDLIFAFGDDVRLNNGNIEVTIPTTQNKMHLSLVTYGKSHADNNDVYMYIMNSVSSFSLEQVPYMLQMVFQGNESDAISGNYILSKDGLSPVANQTESKVVIPYSGKGKYYFCCNPCTVAQPSFIMELDPERRWDIVNGKVVCKFNDDYELSTSKIKDFGTFANSSLIVTYPDQ